jgi:hypothetical protein
VARLGRWSRSFSLLRTVLANATGFPAIEPGVGGCEPSQERERIAIAKEGRMAAAGLLSCDPRVGHGFSQGKQVREPLRFRARPPFSRKSVSMPPLQEPAICQVLLEKLPFARQPKGSQVPLLVSRKKAIPVPAYRNRKHSNNSLEGVS